MDILLLNRRVSSDTKVSMMRQLIIQSEQEGRDNTQVTGLFGRMMQVDMDDAQIPMLCAQYLLSRGMGAQSVPVLEQVVRIDPINKAAHMTLLGSTVRKNDYGQVIKVCEPGIEATPDALEFYFYLAIAHNQAERWDDVLGVSLKALEHITPESDKQTVSDFYTITDNVYHTKRLMKEAYVTYDSTLVYNPSDIDALNNYAYCLSVECRDLDKAGKMSYKAVKAELSNATYLNAYAWALFEKGNCTEAHIYINDAIKNTKPEKESSMVFERCGGIYFMTGDVEDALKHWKKALKLGTESRTLEQKIEKREYITE